MARRKKRRPIHVKNLPNLFSASPYGIMCACRKYGFTMSFSDARIMHDELVNVGMVVLESGGRELRAMHLNNERLMQVWLTV